MKIPFTKAHGARNDFLLTWQRDLPENADLAALAIAICDRHTGVGADGWLVVSGSPDQDASIHLWNSDGSPSEISGNGTRCAAAFLIEAGHSSPEIVIVTGAGLKHLRLLDRRGHAFSFEMNMGRARIEELHARVAESRRGDPERRQSSMRGDGRLLRFRLALAGRLHRAPPALSQSHQRFFRPHARLPYHRRSIFRARRGRNHEFRHRIDRRSRRRRGARPGSRARWKC